VLGWKSVEHSAGTMQIVSPREAWVALWGGAAGLRGIEAKDGLA